MVIGVGVAEFSHREEDVVGQLRIVKAPSNKKSIFAQAVVGAEALIPCP
jgi:hypothetical protein